MKLIYRLLAIVILMISIIILPSCSDKKDKDTERSPEKFITTVYTDIADGRKTLEDFYINDLSLNSSKSITLDEFTALFNGIRITGISDVSSQQIDFPGDPVYKMCFTLSYQKDGQEFSKLCTDYVIYTFNEYKYLLNGYLNRKYYKMAETHDTNEIHCESLSIYNSVNGKIVQVVMLNDTPDSYSLGNDNSGLRMLIKTDAGLLMQTAEDAVILEPNSKKSIDFYFSQPFEKIGNVNITRIYKLDKNGAKINTGDGIEYSFSIAE